MSLVDCITRLKRREKRGRSSRSSSSRLSGDFIYGTTQVGSRSQDSLIVEWLVGINSMEPISDEEVVENELIPVPGPSCLSLTEYLGVNYQVWRASGGNKDMDSGSTGDSEEGWAFRWRIQDSQPSIIRFLRETPVPKHIPPPPYVGDDTVLM